MKKTAKIITMIASPNSLIIKDSCGGKGCLVIKLPFTNLPSWDTDHKQYKTA